MDNLAGSQQQPHTNPAPAAPTPTGRPVLRILGYLFLGLAFLLLFYGAVAYVGWQTGEADRLTAVAEEQQTTISRQIELAEVDIGGGNFQLALRRLEYVLAIDPGNAAAAALHAQANQQLVLRLTPTITPTSTPEPTPTPKPSATPPPNTGEAAREGYLAIQVLVAQRSWAEAVTEIEKFRQNYPDYRRRDVDEMLYEAYVNFGLSLTRGVEIERGILYLHRAAELGDLSEEVLGEIFWAEQYLEGIVFYGIDWQAYLSYFRPMCEFAPLYQNSCGKLAEGLVTFADQYAAQLDYCPAEALYREALRTREISFGEIEEPLTLAADFCLAATPTPEIDLLLTPEVDGGGVVTNSFGFGSSTGGSIPPVVTAEPAP